MVLLLLLWYFKMKKQIFKMFFKDFWWNKKKRQTGRTFHQKCHQKLHQKYLLIIPLYNRMSLGIQMALASVILTLKRPWSKGQIKPKSRLAKNEHKNLICLLWRVKKETKQIRPFVFWKKLAGQKLLSKLTDL